MTHGSATPRVAILADDLNWATRLASIVRLAGAVAVPASTGAPFEAALTDAGGAIVDLSVRGADPVAAIAAATTARVTVIAVGPHEDAVARKRALEAGASRVYAYRKLYDDGPATIARWLDLPVPARPVVPAR